MSKYDFVKKNSHFGTIKDLWLDYKVLAEFLNNYLYYHPNKGLLLSHFSNFYVLVAINENKKMWTKILNKYQYKFLCKNKNYIIGYIWVSTDIKTTKTHFIELCDIRIKRGNIIDLMLYNYKIYEKNVENILPLEITSTTLDYWKTFFNNLDVFNTQELNDFIDMINCQQYVNYDVLKNNFD